MERGIQKLAINQEGGGGMIDVGDIYNHPRESRYNSTDCDMILLVMAIDNVVSALEFMKGAGCLFGSNSVRLLDEEVANE